jgi:hypothetical protein
MGPLFQSKDEKQSAKHEITSAYRNLERFVVQQKEKGAIHPDDSLKYKNLFKKLKQGLIRYGIYKEST